MNGFEKEIETESDIAVHVNEINNRLGQLNTCNISERSRLLNELAASADEIEQLSERFGNHDHLDFAKKMRAFADEQLMLCNCED